MNTLTKIIAVAGAAAALATPLTASARPGGFGGGGFHGGGGFRGAGPGFRAGPGLRGGAGFRGVGFRGGVGWGGGWRGGGWRGAGWGWRGGYGYPVYGWGWPGYGGPAYYGVAGPAVYDAPVEQPQPGPVAYNQSAYQPPVHEYRVVYNHPVTHRAFVHHRIHHAEVCLPTRH